jgi:hypothetical protein
LGRGQNQFQNQFQIFNNEQDTDAKLSKMKFADLFCTHALLLGLLVDDLDLDKNFSAR